MAACFDEKARQKMSAELAALRSKLDSYKAEGLSLDLTRGKPGKEQLDLSTGMLTCVATAEDCVSREGLDCRNYGNLDGLPEMKEMFGELLGLPADHILVGGNASLEMMYHTVSDLMLFGAGNGATPWGRQGAIKFLCPAPGYDRHFAITKAMGIEMIPVALGEDGPDMNEVERLVLDPAVKGIWCVPKFSNPDGIVYSDETVRRLATMKTGADDFRIFWDNAYAIHEVVEETVPLADIFALAGEAGNEDRILGFASTSKVAMPGAGVACMMLSPANMAYFKGLAGARTIGPDKLNQLRHLKFFGNAEGILAQMRRHAAIIRPRFELVIDTFRRELAGTGARFTEPKGGYFVSLYVKDGCAKRVYQLASEAGVKLTAVGAAFPYGNDPHDSHLRIAPTYPSAADLKKALEILCTCVKAASLEKDLEG